MRSILRTATNDTRRAMRRREAERLQQQAASEEELRGITAQLDDGDDSDDSEDMPPLLEDPPQAQSASSASNSSSNVGGGGYYPSPARFAFRPQWKQCVPDYSCCLRYGMRLAVCCMPSPSEFTYVPSFRWLQSRFRQLHADKATLAFLGECDDNFYVQGWCSSWGLRVGVLKPLLRRCMAHTDVNGLLGCGQMFLVSSEQVSGLLRDSIPAAVRASDPSAQWPWSLAGGPGGRRSRLLDVGAGDGHITAFVSRFFSETVATEVAAQMVRRLRARGFTTVHTGDLDEGLPLDGPVSQDGFDLVTLFNVLDRCSRPRTLLKQIRARLRRPEGGVNSSRVILSVPLPLDPSVEVGTKWLDPEESILSASRAARDFEASLCALAEMLLGAGFNIESVSRVPYLSQGDTWRPFYVLDASLWVLSPRYDGDPLPADLEPATIPPHAHTGKNATGSPADGHSHARSTMALEVD